MQVTCPHCNSTFEVSRKQDGFRDGTKGAYIEQLIFDAGSEGINTRDLELAVLQKFTEGSTGGRLQMVLRQLRGGKAAEQYPVRIRSEAGRHFWLNGDTPPSTAQTQQAATKQANSDKSKHKKTKAAAAK